VVDSSRGLVVEAGEDVVEQLLTAGLVFGSSVVALALQPGAELDGGLKVGAGLPDRLEGAVGLDGAGALAVWRACAGGPRRARRRILVPSASAGSVLGWS
jgi:hypothetical protein